MRLVIKLLSVGALLIGTCASCAVGAAQTGAGDCPPHCDTIPASAWIDPESIPLYDTYQWPALGPLAVSVPAPRFQFEDQCAIPPTRHDPREFAVAERVIVNHPAGDWQLQAQVLHWRGETWRTGQTAMTVLRTAADALRTCQHTAPGSSPTITTDLGTGVAAVISIAGQRVLRQYLLADPRNGTVVELAMWASSPPRVPWQAAPDAQVLAGLAVPLCTAYIDSCH